MPENQKQTGTGGSEIIRSAVAQAIDVLSGQLLKKAKDNGGGLTAPDIRSTVEHFKEQPDTILANLFEETWLQCPAGAESAHWTAARKFHFERIMVKCFSSLLPSNDEIIQPGRHLSRRIIPGFIYALQQMMGPEIYERYGDRTTTLVDTLRAVHGDEFTWNEVYGDPTCQDVVEQVLVDIAHHFSDMAKRRNWMIDVVDAQMPATSDDSEKAWFFDDGAFHALMNMLYSSLREQSQDPVGLRDLEARLGEEKVAALRILLDGLQIDHADLMHAGRL